MVAHCQAIKIKDESDVLSSFLPSVPVVKCGDVGDEYAADFVLSGPPKDPRSTSDASRATVSLAQCHEPAGNRHAFMLDVEGEQPLAAGFVGGV